MNLLGHIMFDIPNPIEDETAFLRSSRAQAIRNSSPCCPTGSFQTRHMNVAQRTIRSNAFLIWGNYPAENLYDLVSFEKALLGDKPKEPEPTKIRPDKQLHLAEATQPFDGAGKVDKGSAWTYPLVYRPSPVACVASIRFRAISMKKRIHGTSP